MYTMKQACEMTGLSYETLKYYCNEGLIPGVKRDRNNRRIFGEREIGWIRGLICLKECGMGIHEMKQYLATLLSEAPDINLLKGMLEAKRKELEESIRHAEESLHFIQWKQAHYDAVLSGERELFDLLDTYK